MEHLLEGNISVKAALLAKKRNVMKIMVDKQKKDKDTAFILRLAKQENVAISTCNRDEIDALASGKTHGGMIAFCDDRSYGDLTNLIKQGKHFFALVEGVEDPFNFGYVLRNLYAAGCEGVIVPPRNWSTAAGVVAKASAGASEYIELIIAEDLEATLQTLKAHRITIVCGLRKDDAMNLYDYAFPNDVCIAIGGELRGLSKSVQNASDQNLYIPYANDFRNAMTAASSTAIFAFEYMRQSQTSK